MNKDFTACKNNSKCKANLDYYDTKCISSACADSIKSILKMELINFNNAKIQYEKIISDEKKYEFQPHRIVAAKLMIDSYNSKIKDIKKSLKSNLKDNSWIRFVPV
jgi:hypothetical protein